MKNQVKHGLLCRVVVQSLVNASPNKTINVWDAAAVLHLLGLRLEPEEARRFIQQQFLYSRRDGYSTVVMNGDNILIPEERENTSTPPPDEAPPTQSSDAWLINLDELPCPTKKLKQLLLEFDFPLSTNTDGKDAITRLQFPYVAEALNIMNEKSRTSLENAVRQAVATVAMRNMVDEARQGLCRNATP
jgi:hypothetical protein